MSKTKRILFKALGPPQSKFDYMGRSFLLEEKSVGTYGLGKCISLYSFDPFTLDKKFIVCVGWTSGDNHGSTGSKDSVLKGNSNTWPACKIAAENYLNKLLN